MSQLAVLRACQIPSRLGFPFGIRGTALLDSEPADWPLAERCPARNATAAASTSTPANTTAALVRKRMAVLLLDSISAQNAKRKPSCAVRGWYATLLFCDGCPYLLLLCCVVYEP